MRKLLAICTGLIFAFAISGATTALAQEQGFAVGSAKTEVAVFIGNEHASFSAHNTGVTETSFCEASGQIVYKSDLAEFTARIERLIIAGTPGAKSGGIAKLGARITKVVSGPYDVDEPVGFYVSDGDKTAPDGFLFAGFDTEAGFCGVVAGEGPPPQKGNIVIKSEPLL
jgi:hypothetical protein